MAATCDASGAAQTTRSYKLSSATATAALAARLVHTVATKELPWRPERPILRLSSYEDQDLDVSFVKHLFVRRSSSLAVLEKGTAAH